MNREQLDQHLQQRAASPTPALQPDPFLPTRIRARNGAEEHALFAGLSWAMRSVLAAAALITGIYVGGQLPLNGPAESDGYHDEAFGALVSAVSPRSLSDDFEEALLTGEVEDE